MNKPPQNLRDFSSLVDIVKTLRGPEGCPWDREQTHQSLTRFAIEEAHELAEAIQGGLDQDVVEELGDLLLQVVLHSEMARQENRFDIHDVIQAIGKKMIRRHPHVFSDLKVNSSKEVLENWEQIKSQEKGSEKQSQFDFRVPQGIPALLASHKIGEKSRRWHFDWSQPTEVMKKVEEELAELQSALPDQNPKEIEHEIGDLLFSVAQLARHLELDSEACLRGANRRFQQRFEKMQELCAQDKKHFDQLNHEEREAYWEKAKKVTG